MKSKLTLKTASSESMRNVVQCSVETRRVSWNVTAACTISQHREGKNERKGKTGKLVCVYKAGDTWNPTHWQRSPPTDASIMCSHLSLRSDGGKRQTAWKSYEPHRIRFLWAEKHVSREFRAAAPANATAKCKIQLAVLICLLNETKKTVWLGSLSVELHIRWMPWWKSIVRTGCCLIPEVISDTKTDFPCKQLISRGNKLIGNSHLAWK